VGSNHEHRPPQRREHPALQTVESEIVDLGAEDNDSQISFGRDFSRGLRSRSFPMSVASLYSVVHSRAAKDLLARDIAHHGHISSAFPDKPTT
jgi:hypothetical protein